MVYLDAKQCKKILFLKSFYIFFYRLEVGLEVEYTVFNRDKGGKVSAENVKLLRKGTIPPIPGKDEVLHGKVVRPLRSVNPDQNDYCGLIQVKNEDGSGKKILSF